MVNLLITKFKLWIVFLLDDELNFIIFISKDVRFPDQFAVFDGKYFIVSAQIRSHFLYIWISVVQDLSVEGDGDGPTQDDETILTEIKKRAEESNYTAVITIAPEQRSVN